MNFRFGFGDHDAIFGLELKSDLAVEGQEGRLVALGEIEFDARGIGNDQRAVGQHVRTDRSDDESVEGRMDDRAAGGERIGGGTGRRGHDQAVGAVAAHVTAVDGDIEIEHAGQRRLVGDGVVQRALLFGRLSEMNDFRVEHHTVAGAMLAGQHAFEYGVEFVQRDARQKAEAAEIDREDREIVAVHGAGGGEQGAVAAEHDQQINFGRHFFAGQGRTVGVQGGRGARVDEGFDFARMQPIAQRRNDRGHHIRDGFADDAGGPNHV